MKASVIKLADLKDFSDCIAAIDKIENDYRNYEGGIGRWTSGKECFLKAGAKTKIDAINKKANSLPDEE